MTPRKSILTLHSLTTTVFELPKVANRSWYRLQPTAFDSMLESKSVPPEERYNEQQCCCLGSIMMTTNISFTP